MCRAAPSTRATTCCASPAARLASIALLAGSLAGCEEFFGDQDARRPGDLLGTFHVTATAASNTCGTGALGAPAAFEFDVELSRDNGLIYWLAPSGPIQGRLAADGVTFAFEAQSIVDMRSEESPGVAPCSLVRRDGTTGVLGGEDNEDITSFTGSLTYTFEPTRDSICDDLVVGGDLAVEPIFAALPCGMAYDLVAERTEAPIDE